ncbi:hypothetical protein ACFL08_05425 [Patescibacteria group bacterium]
MKTNLKNQPKIRKKFVISLFLTFLMLLVMSGVLYYIWLNLVNNAKYDPTFMCDWEDQVRTGCVDKINRANITEEELKIIIKEENVRRDEMSRFVDSEIVRIEKWLKDALGDKEGVEVLFKKSELLRLKTAKDILLNM